MIFKNLIKRNFDGYSFNATENGPNSISLYPISEFNLEGVKILFNNCKNVGTDNSNVRIATVDPALWLGDFLDKYWKKISYVSSAIKFTVYQIEGNSIVNKEFSIITKEFKSEEELDDIFKDGQYKSLVLFSVMKIVNLIDLTYLYRVRYSDITQKYEIRDKKINDLIN